MIRRLLSQVPRGLFLGLMPGLLVIGASGAHPAYANTGFSSGQIVNGLPTSHIVNLYGLCVDVFNDTPEMNRCDDTRATQFWKSVNVPNHPGVFLLRQTVAGGDCLDIKDHDTSAGAQVVLRECTFGGSDPFELWFTENVVSSGLFQLANKGDGTDLVMHPSGCMSKLGLPLFMNERSQCQADDWV